MTYNQLRNYAIAALGLVGVVSMTLYVGTFDWQARTISPITVDGQTIEFTYTDKIAGEDMIIVSDRAEYTNGLSHAIIYLAVANNSGVNQDIELMGYFRDTRKRVKDISVLTNVTQEFQDPVFTEQCQEVTGTTTRNVCTQVQTGTTTRQVTKATWAPLPTKSRDSLEIAKEAGLLAGVTRDDVRDFIAEKKSVHFPIKKNEVLYYKVVIEFPAQERDEVFFEVVGSAGGYGFLK